LPLMTIFRTSMVKLLEGLRITGNALFRRIPR
jgi:hypothetical protein